MRIERIEVFITDFPIRLLRQVSSGAYDTGPSGHPLGKPVFVKVFAEGVIGHAQIRPITPGHFMPETVHSVVGAIVDIYGPRLIGHDLFDLESAWAIFDRVLPQNANARALIDHALHDAIGKLVGLPVYKLLGGLCQPRIPLEWSVSMADDQQVMIDEARRAVEEFGIRVLSIKAGGRAGWQQDVKNLAAIRKTVGDGIALGVDPNAGWTVDEASRAIRQMAEHRLDYIEQPVARRDVSGLAFLRRLANGIPVMADESIMTLEDAYALARAEAADVFCVKLYKVGGLRQAGKIAAIAEAANVRVNVGGLAVLSQLEAAAGAHFYASLPGHRVMPAAEFVFGLGVIGSDPLVPETDFVAHDGYAEPPRGPGLGITVDDKAVARYTLRHEVIS